MDGHVGVIYNTGYFALYIFHTFLRQDASFKVLYPGHTSCHADGNAARCIFGIGQACSHCSILLSLLILLARFLTFMPEEQAIGIAKQPFSNSKAAIRLTLCGKYSWRTVVEPDIADLSR